MKQYLRLETKQKKNVEEFKTGIKAFWKTLTAWANTSQDQENAGVAGKIRMQSLPVEKRNH